LLFISEFYLKHTGTITVVKRKTRKNLIRRFHLFSLWFAGFWGCFNETIVLAYHARYIQPRCVECWVDLRDTEILNLAERIYREITEEWVFEELSFISDTTGEGHFYGRVGEVVVEDLCKGRLCGRYKSY